MLGPVLEYENLKFAVANVDEGYRSNLIPVKVTVGDQVVNALRANSQLDWTITSKADASRAHDPANTTRPS